MPKKKVNSIKLQESLDHWKRLHNNVAETNKRFQAQVHDLTVRLKTMEMNLANAQKASDINKNMLRQMGEAHTKKEQELIKLLTQLKAKLREMGYDGSFDNLGD